MAPADEALARGYPGDPGVRQPVHTVYVPADRVTQGIAARYGTEARAALDAHAPDPGTLAEIVGADADRVAEVWPLLLAKLDREPVEDLRIDLEDGYRGHSDDEEDADAVAAVAALAVAGLAGGEAPPYWGIRFKCFEAPTRTRGLRTLDLVLGAALDAGPLPDGFRLTLPKVTSVEQVLAMAEACTRLEAAYGLDAGRLRFEVQVETAQAVLGPDGAATVARLVHAARRPLQRAALRHLRLHRGARHRGRPPGHGPPRRGPREERDAAGLGRHRRPGLGRLHATCCRPGPPAQVRAGWARHFRLVGRSLERGLYQGWDLHPAQLPTRFLATFLFFRTGLDEAGGRLRDYLAGTGGSVLDEPATARALAGFVRRGVHCGAVTAEEATALTGVSLAVLDDLARGRG